MIVGGQAGRLRGADFWEPVFRLFDRVWPGMPGRIALAERWGAAWAPQTTPFAWMEGGRALAHVGVLVHRVLLQGKPQEVAGIHAVCSDPDARGRGHVRALLEEALRWVDQRYPCAKLHTGVPALYARFGFRTVPTHVFVTDARGGGGGARPLADTPEDLSLLRRALAARAPLSPVLDHLDPGALAITNAALDTSSLRWFHHLPGDSGLPGDDTLLLLDRAGDDLVVLDLAARGRPRLEAVLAGVPFPFRRVVYAFAPGAFDPSARPVPVPASAGAFMVRGDWPDLPPFGVPTPWQH